MLWVKSLGYPRSNGGMAVIGMAMSKKSLVAFGDFDAGLPDASRKGLYKFLIAVTLKNNEHELR